MIKMQFISGRFVLCLCFLVCKGYGIFALSQNGGNSTVEEEEDKLEICPIILHRDAMNETEENECLPSQMSCRDACGTSTSACSCAPICIVYSNCCEDYADECAERFERSSRLYRSELIDSACDETDTLSVSACHGEPKITFQQRFVEFDLETKVGQVSKKIGLIMRRCWEDAINTFNFFHNLRDVNDQSEFMASLHKLFYVTDINTQIVYRSLELFHCHAKITSVPCVWKVKMVSGGDIQDAFHSANSKIITQSPVQILTKRLSKCKYKARAECDETSKFFSPTRRALCLSFTSPVKTNNGSTFVFYKNRHCMACETGSLRIHEQMDSSDFETVKSSSFSAILSLTKYDIEISRNTPDRYDSWLTSRCSLSGHCRNTVCDEPRYVLRPDGYCKFPFTLYIAMTITTDRLNIKRLLELIKCVLHRHEQWDVDDGQLPQLKAFKFQDDSEMYGMSVDFYARERGDHQAQLKKLAVETGNYLVDIINNDTMFCEHQQEEQINRYSFDADEPLENGTWHIIRKGTYTIGNPYPGPFCGGVRIKDGAQYDLMCFPVQRNHTAWSQRLTHVQNMSCVDRFLSISDSGSLNHMETLVVLLLVIIQCILM